MKLPALDVNMLFLGATVGDIMSELVLKHYDKDSDTQRLGKLRTNSLVYT